VDLMGISVTTGEGNDSVARCANACVSDHVSLFHGVIIYGRLPWLPNAPFPADDRTIAKCFCKKAAAISSAIAEYPVAEPVCTFVLFVSGIFI